MGIIIFEPVPSELLIYISMKRFILILFYYFLFTPVAMIINMAFFRRRQKMNSQTQLHSINKTYGDADFKQIF